jgi:hypothetical protein
MPRLRPRISLFAAFLLTTIVGMAMVVALQWREIGPLRTEVRRLRSELGYLTIDDPKRACAVSVPSFEDDTRKWRIYLPVGGQYSICSRSGNLPSRPGHLGNSWFDEVRKSGSGMSSTGTSLHGEFLLEGRLIKENDSWVFVTNYSQSDGSMKTSSQSKDSIYQPSGDWLSDRRSRITSSDVAFDQKSFEPGKSILLLHLVRPEITDLPGGGHKSKTPQGAADGFSIWIEQQPPATKSPAPAP